MTRHALSASRISLSSMWRKLLDGGSRKPHRFPSRVGRLNLEGLENRLAPAADLTQISAGFQSGVFYILQQQLNSQVFHAPLLMIGNQLETTAAGQVLD